MRKRPAYLLFLTSSSILAATLISPASAQTPVWGPERFERGTGKPATSAMSFAAPDTGWEYTLVLYTGTEVSRRVSAAEVTINGTPVAVQSDFNQNVGRIERPLTLAGTNTIEVYLAGVPESELTAVVLGPHSTSTVDPAGGTVELDGFVRVEFPAGAFDSTTEVSLSVSSRPETDELFREGTSLFNVATRSPYEIRIHTGDTPPAESSFVTIPVPAGLGDVGPDGQALRLYAAFVYFGEEELIDFFEPVAFTYNSASHSVDAVLPADAYINFANVLPGFEAVLILATVGSSGAAGAVQGMIDLGLEADADDICRGLRLQLPVPPESEPKDSDGKPLRRRFSTSFRHYGVDLKVPNSTPVTAAAAGIIRKPPSNPQGEYVKYSELKAKWDVSCTDPDRCKDGPICTNEQGTGADRKCMKGYGWRIQIQHTDGQVTQYGHLLEGSLINPRTGMKWEAGDAVYAGDLIALSDASGGVTGPHLHFEYAPNGQTGLGQDGRIDPEKCFGCELRVTSIVPLNGAVVPAGRSTRIRPTIGPAGAAVDPGTVVQVVVNKQVRAERTITGTGLTSLTIPGFPNFWDRQDVDVTVQVVQNGSVCHDTTVTYTAVYDWSSINQGPWQFEYSWVFDWKSKRDPGRTALETHSGSGYIGAYRNYAAPFNEHFTRTAWVNEYDFEYNDETGCSYLSIGSYPGNLVQFQLNRRTCFNPPTGSLDLHDWMKYGYIANQEGGFSFVGPEGPTDEYSGELDFRLKDGVSYPEIICLRTYKRETTDVIWTLRFDVHLTRIPSDEWPPAAARYAAAEPVPAMPSLPRLDPPAPNPFNPSTTVSYSLPEATNVKLEVFNILGQRVVVLTDDYQSAGQHQVTWDGSRHASGLYLIRLSAGREVAVRRAMLIK